MTLGDDYYNKTKKKNVDGCQKDEDEDDSGYDMIPYYEIPLSRAILLLLLTDAVFFPTCSVIHTLEPTSQPCKKIKKKMNIEKELAHESCALWCG
jgi:hypothetical protein